MEVRTRMAPSPTGEYHIGHIRTVLYNYAFAKKNKGKFVIRIEDTDRERFVEGATDRILDVLRDYGLNWDEGPRVGGSYAPYIQSERLELYKTHAHDLVKKDFAYYCFCDEIRLENLRKSQQEKKLPVTRYDKHCLTLTKSEIDKNLSKNKPYVIRLKVKEGEVITFKDEVLGEITVNSKDIDDAVLLKSDGYPTYHLAVVVDDHLMKITHVMRGCDWLPSTPKHVLLYKAFGWELPKFVHLPNLKEVGSTKKLSKRFGAVEAAAFLKEGYLPEALLNFIMLLGWNPGTDKEIFTLPEFINEFSIERLHATDLVAFDREKLLWMNGYYIRSLEPGLLYEKILNWSSKFNTHSNLSRLEKTSAVKCLQLIADRMKKLSDFDLLTEFVFSYEKVSPELFKKYSEDKTIAILKGFHHMLETWSTSWETTLLDSKAHEFLTQSGLKPKEAFMTLRLAICGKEVTPPLFPTLEFLGKDVVLKRLSLYI